MDILQSRWATMKEKKLVEFGRSIEIATCAPMESQKVFGDASRLHVHRGENREPDGDRSEDGQPTKGSRWPMHLDSDTQQLAQA
jgi:hypothetical protein